MSDRGWICPKCEAVLAPSQTTCPCSPPKKAVELGDFWEQMRKLAKEFPQPVYVPMPYPVYPQPHWHEPQWWRLNPGITYTTNTIDVTPQLRCFGSESSQ